MSSTSNIPLWGQAYELTVTYAQPNSEPTTVTLSSNAWEPEALRIKFEVLQSTLPSPWWFADITVYNLNKPERANALQYATWVELKAGFQTGPSKSTIIWNGPVMQTILTRENVVDIGITFHCVANPFAMESIISFSSGPYSSQAQLLVQMSNAIGLPEVSATNGTVGQAASTALDAKKYLRGNTVFGKMGKYILQIANDQFMQTWRDGQKAYITNLSNPDLTPFVTYSPPYPPGVPVPPLSGDTTFSLIGTPQQTPQGVIFTVLLDPRLSVVLPPKVVQLKRTVVNVITVSPGGGVATPLSSDLKLLVSQVRHVGDSRGNDWYTEVTGVSTTYAQSMLDGVFGATAAGGN